MKASNLYTNTTVYDGTDMKFHLLSALGTLIFTLRVHLNLCMEKALLSAFLADRIIIEHRNRKYFFSPCVKALSVKEIH